MGGSGIQASQSNGTALRNSVVALSTPDVRTFKIAVGTDVITRQAQLLVGRPPRDAVGWGEYWCLVGG